MYSIKIHIQGSEKFLEILPQSLEEAECMVEDIVSCSLMQIFDIVIVEEVTIRYFPMERQSNKFSVNDT